MSDSPGSALRTLFAPKESEVLIFATDLASEPPSAEYWFNINPLAHLKCSRALPIAESADIVALPGALNRPYYEWLRSLGFGPAEVVAYDVERPAVPLAQMIISDPQPLLKAIRRTGKAPVYVPFFANQQDHQAAALLDAEIYGCDPKVTLPFYDKDSFKEMLRLIGAPSVEGGVRSRVPAASTGPSAHAFAQIFSALLKNYSGLIVRGAFGASGSSVYRMETVNMADVLEKLQQHAGSNLLIEPFLKVIASPNDQWGIDRDGGIHHIGISSQLFSGLKHAGNIYGQYFAQRVTDAISATSRLVIEHMAAAGYRGIAGLDYIVCDEGIFPIENNARFNGSSFAFGIFDRVKARLPMVRCWKFFKATVDPCSFEALAARCAPLLYNDQRINSVFPFDCDALTQNGSFTALLIAEDMYHIEYLESSLMELGVKRL